MASRLDLTGIDLSGIDRRELLALLIDAALEAELHTQGGAERAARFAAERSGGRAAEFYSPDQPRDDRGRWSQSQGGGLAHAYARQKVKEALSTGKPYTDDHVKDLADHLGRLTVAQLHALKAEHGLKASGRNKAALIAKLAERFHGSRDKDVDTPGKPGSKTYADLKAQAVQAAQRPGWTNPRIAVNDWAGSGRVALVDHPASGHSLRINQAGTIDVQHTRTGQPATSIAELHGHAGKSLADMQVHVEGAHERAGREAIQGLAGQTPGKARQPEPVAGKVAAKLAVMKSAAQVTGEKLAAAKSEPPAAIKDIARTRVHYEGGKHLPGAIASMSKKDLDAVDAHLVKIGHPLASQPGSQQSRAESFARELGGPKPPAAGNVDLFASHKIGTGANAREMPPAAAKAVPAAKPAAELPKGWDNLLGTNAPAAAPAAAKTSRFSGAKGIADAFDQAGKLSDADHAEAMAAVDRAPKAELLGALKLMGMAPRPSEDQKQLASRVKRFINEVRDNTQKAARDKGHPLIGGAGFSADRPRTLDFAVLTAGAAESTTAYAESRNGFNRRAGIAFAGVV